LFARTVLDEKNGPPPEINLFNEKNNGETLLKLIDSSLVKSAHDVSLGGIITAVSKMCIKGNKGINLKKPKYLINEIEYFFAEDQGRYIIEITKENLKKVTDILNKNAVHFDELGTINENQLYFNEKTKVTIDELKTSNKSWLINYMSK
jgi:phosphoribosylformylglycinamidine synthase